ncbi:hypothetical protein AGR9A_Lc40497 [Agrobacterium salinitolerans str. Hayward 0363]|nr:hypothetical protein AGR9A_Lc40497 [Agrobacterium salinitolerans str. Hayward 0363]
MGRWDSSRIPILDWAGYSRKNLVAFSKAIIGFSDLRNRIFLFFPRGFAEYTSCHWSAALLRTRMKEITSVRKKSLRACSRCWR